ncbi:fimbrillin family protein [Bacteroides ovatus]|nr:fimbrillin family protein [Bacteroides ovatus]
MSGKTATPTGSALTDTEFFAPLVSAWQPQDDQSTHAAYTASDLMTAEGSATTGEDNTLHLSFTMNHRMALPSSRCRIPLNTSLPTRGFLITPCHPPLHSLALPSRCA